MPTTLRRKHLPHLKTQVPQPALPPQALGVPPAALPPPTPTPTPAPTPTAPTTTPAVLTLREIALSLAEEKGLTLDDRAFKAARRQLRNRYHALREQDNPLGATGRWTFLASDNQRIAIARRALLQAMTSPPRPRSTHPTTTTKGPVEK